MWEYRKEIVESKDIVSEMDRMGEYGWEVFSLTERMEVKERHGDKEKTTYYTLYMKRRVK